MGYRMPSRRMFFLASGPLILPFLLAAQSSAPHDWTTWGYDQERTGWNRGETTLSKDNVSKLGIKWTAQIATTPTDIALSTMTAPIVVEGVNTPQGRKSLIIVVGSDDQVYTMDADTGAMVWQKSFPNTLKPKMTATWLCPNTQNATPVVDKEKGIVYVNTSDGKLRGLDVASGQDRMPPIDFTEPHARNWSLNLIDNVVYTPSARGCGGVSANFAAVDLTDPAHPAKYYYYASEGRPGGAWGRGGVVRGPRGIYTQTADGVYDPAAGLIGESVMVLSFKTMHLLDSFTPPNWQEMNQHDLDLGAAGPVVFPYGGKTLVASIAKEAVLYLLDASALGGGEQDSGALRHDQALYTSPTLGNDEKVLAGRGIWGAISTYQDPQGGRWLYVPMWGPPSKNAPEFQTTDGPAPEGSIMAFQVTGDAAKPSLVAKWRSNDMHVPDPPVVANGVVYAIQTGENTAQGGGGPGRGGAGRGGAGRGGAAGAAAGGAPPDGPPAPGRGGAAGAAGPGRGAAGFAGRGNPATAAKARATPITNLTLYAYDAQTGKKLYSSEKLISSWVHFSEPVVALGKVFVVTWDGHVYAFGLK